MRYAELAERQMKRMNSLNESGNMVETPELRYTPNNIAVTTFRIAVRRPGSKDTTDFFTCVAWRKTAEYITKYFKKGDGIGITGMMTTRPYTDKSGNKRTAYEIIVGEVSFFSKANNNSSLLENNLVEEFEPGDDPDLPF